MNGRKKSFQQNSITKMKHAEVKNKERRHGRNAEILAERADLQLGKWKPTWNWTWQRTTRTTSLSMQVTKGRLRENVSQLLSVPRDLVTQGIVKAEVLDTVFTWPSTRKTGLQQFQALDTSGKIWDKKMHSWWQMIKPGNTVVSDGTHPQMLRELPAAIPKLLLITLKHYGNWEKHTTTEGKEISLQTVTMAGRRTQGTTRLASLTSVPAKVMEHIILEMIIRHIKDKKVTGSSLHEEILLN